MNHFETLLRGIYDALRGAPAEDLPDVSPLDGEWISEMIELRSYDVAITERQRRMEERRNRR